jgi:7,8-dihydropterin-6-yl-methyl-4-(beta-D-ribofuranosyl)aminobenzene 5'-phosphate synthase
MSCDSNLSGQQLSEVDMVRVWFLTDNYYDALRPDSEIAKRYRTTPGRCLHAEHGLAYFVETKINGNTSTCMFDFGLDAQGVLNNAVLLNVDLGRADAFALSHGHFDHWAGAIEMLKHNTARIARGTRFYVGEEGFLHRYSRRPGADEIMDLGVLDKAAIEGSGVKVTEVSAPTQIVPGCCCTGKIERITDYENMSANLLVERGGKIGPDDFRGEQALFFNVRGKGVVVLSGCAHAGIVNTVRQVQKVSGVEKVHAILGGFHLINAKPEVIDATVSDIKAMRPDFIAPAHCTGFEALVAFSRAMHEEFILNTAGTQYTFSAE